MAKGMTIAGKSYPKPYWFDVLQRLQVSIRTPLHAISKFKMIKKSRFYEAKENVPTASKQYKHRGNASNLVQFHFGSPQLKELESGIAPLVPRSFYLHAGV